MRRKARRRMTKHLIELGVAFAVLSFVFFVAQRIWPSVRGQKTFRRGFATDCIYWLWTPIVTRAITPVAVGIALIPIAALYGMNLKTIVHGHGALAAQPLWSQGLEIFVVGDFLGYWQHRLF